MGHRLPSEFMGGDQGEHLRAKKKNELKHLVRKESREAWGKTMQNEEEKLGMNGGPCQLA